MAVIQSMSEAAPPAGKAAGELWALPGEAVASVELAALPVTPFWARRHAEAVLGAWLLPPETIETAVLLVSELVTNANAATTRQAQQPTENAAFILQTLRRQPGRIVIEVSDSDPSPPVLEEAGLDAESGRGLMLVQALSKEWSYYFPPSGGKTVYCVISVTDAASATTGDQPQ